MQNNKLGEYMNKELPKGITIRKYNKSEAIQIFFMYRNVRCREIINLPPTKENIKKAFNKRHLILAEIEAKTFDYAFHFPNSSKVELFCEKSTVITMGELLNKQLNDYSMMHEKGNLSIATLKSYTSATKILVKFFADILVKDLSPLDIKDWLVQQSLNDISIGTLRNRLSVLNMALDEAKNDRLIKINPMSEISINKQINRTASKSDYEVQPFTEEEKIAIINSAEGQVKNLIQFNFWAGLRISELIALKWSDIDFNNGVINIQRARVETIIKTTKTKSGIRKVLLLKPARDALEDQLLYTQGKEFVFNNPRTKKEWMFCSVLNKHWQKVLKNAGVKYRNPYQMRHTYASTLLSNNENIFWLSTQMGHINTQMIIKHYGKWIPQNDKNGYNVIGDYK